MVTVLIVFSIIILAIIHGFKKGLTKEISSLICWAVTLFVMTLVIMLYTSFSASEGKNMIITIVILVITGIIYSIIKFVFKPAKIIAKLPLFRILDQLLGLVIGIVEGFVLVWLLYVLNESGVLGSFGDMIRADTAKNEILSLIYEHNYLIKIAAGF